ncbi:MAG: hypothetical protein KDC11_05715 [Chitinophagaceae bacterium]|nr:hypothetical protein [Chitinophagaceae bacterium]
MIDVLNDIIPLDFSDDSRVWVYQSSRAFIEKEEKEINEQLLQFYSQWESHGTPVKGWARLIFRQFIVFMADEAVTGVSGCSTDSSVRVVKSIERQYDVNMFDRLMLTFLVNEKAQMLPLNQVQYALDKAYISKDTPLFNNVVGTKKDLMNNWLIPIKDSWLSTRVKLETI